MDKGDKITIIFVSILFAALLGFLCYTAKRNIEEKAAEPIAETDEIVFEYKYSALSLTFTTKYYPGGKEWITAESGKVFVIVNFDVRNTNKKKAQKLTEPFVLKVAESDLTFDDRCPWAERSLAGTVIDANSAINDDVCFEVPEELAESAFLLEHNGQQWQIPPMEWGSR